MSGASGVPFRARLLIGGAVVGGALTLAFALVHHGGWSQKDVLKAGAVLGLMLIAELFWIALPQGSQAENFSLVGVIFTAGLVLVPSGPLLVAVALGIAIGQLPRRPPANKLAFNVGMHVIGMGAAAAVSASVTSHWGSAAAITGVVLGMAAYFVVNEAAVAAIIAAVENRSFVRTGTESLRISGETWAADLALGLIAAFLWRERPIYLVALIAPVILSYTALRSRIRTMREAQKMEEMALAAAAISQQEDLARRMPETGETPHLSALSSTLNRMLDRLEAAFNRERRFIRDASHELRTPVTITRGYLEVLGSQPEPEELQEALDVAFDELDRMGRLITDLTSLAKVDDPGFVMPDEVNVAEFVERIAAKIRPALGERLRYNLPESSAVMHVDDQRLTQALLNLLQNAIVHTDGDSPIELRTSQSAGVWRFEVIDRGGGVPEGEEELIFQPFHRVNRDRPGSGLGLAIVRGIAEGHDGRAGVDNRPGDGATFWVEIPA